MIYLHVKSWFSFLNGGSSPEELVARAAALGMPALGLTDQHGVYGAVRFQKACREQGIKPIIGAQVSVGGTPLVLLARTSYGYAQLCRVITMAQSTSREAPTLTLDQLAMYSSDLVCL